MNNRLVEDITWAHIVKDYTVFKLLRPESIRNYSRFIALFSRSFGQEFTHINALTAEKVATFRSFF